MSARGMCRARARADRRAHRRRLATGAIVTAAGAIAPAAAQAADFPVTNTDATGPGSLRAAIVASNVSADAADTISFASSVTGTIDLGADDIDIYGGALSVNGPGADVLTVDAGGADRIFDIFDIAVAGRPVTISGLTLTGGDTAGSGGAIYNWPNNDYASDLTVRDCVITGNESGNDGGGIHSMGGNLTVLSSTFSGNSADGNFSDGGGIYVLNTSGTGPGVTYRRQHVRRQRCQRRGRCLPRGHRWRPLDRAHDRFRQHRR